MWKSVCLWSRGLIYPSWNKSVFFSSEKYLMGHSLLLHIIEASSSHWVPFHCFRGCQKIPRQAAWVNLRALLLRTKVVSLIQIAAEFLNPTCWLLNFASTAFSYSSSIMRSALPGNENRFNSRLLLQSIKSPFFQFTGTLFSSVCIKINEILIEMGLTCKRWRFYKFFPSTQLNWLYSSGLYVSGSRMWKNSLNAIDFAFMYALKFNESVLTDYLGLNGHCWWASTSNLMPDDIIHLFI